MELYLQFIMLFYSQAEIKRPIEVKTGRIKCAISCIQKTVLRSNEWLAIESDRFECPMNRVYLNSKIQIAVISLVLNYLPCGSS
jgi:hypothetical protein